jgi:hypothetical protein
MEIMPVEKKVTAQAQRETKVHETYTIQPGCLFWDISDGTPIGSKAKRAPEDGAKVHDNEELKPQWHSCNRIGHWKDRRIAFTTEYTSEHYHDK